MHIERLFTHNLAVTFDGIGSYEVHTVPHDGSRVITVSSPIHEECEVAFQYCEDNQKWISVNLEGTSWS